MRKSVTPTVEGGLLVAMTVLFGLAAVYVPIVGMFFDFFFAVPVAVLTARRGAGYGLGALFAAFVLLSMLISPLMSLRLALGVGLCGVALGWGVRKNFNAVRIFFTTLVVASVTQVLSLALLTFVMDVNLIDEQKKILREVFTYYEAAGIDRAQLDAAGELVMMLLPTLLMLMAAINTAMVYLSARWIFPKLRLTMPSLPSFSAWRFPALFFYLAAFGGLGIYWGMSRGWTEIHMIAVNVTFVAMFLGFVQGLAFLSFVADRFRFSKFFRGALFVMVIINPFMYQVTAIAGLGDMVIDYRKILRDKAEGTNDDEQSR